MTASNPTESPLDRAADVADERATEAFSLLGNETRLAILLALWEAYEPLAADNAVPFSELRERVGMRDSGQFNYHLDNLTGHFVRATDDGYELREAGQTFVRTIIAGAGLEATELPPTEIDVACHRCGAGRARVSYRDESLYLTCSECEGFITADELPEGILARWVFHPAGLARRTPGEIFVVGSLIQIHQAQLMRDGVCPECSGPVDSSLSLCEEHAPGPGTVCPNCGTRDSVRVAFRCTVCKNWDEIPVQGILGDHPVVAAFYYDRGVDLTRGPNDVEAFTRQWALFWEQEHALVSTDPVRIRVTVPCDGDELELTLDGDLHVIDAIERT